MNKYTLQFRSNNLEEKYQKHRFHSTIPACKSINLMCFSVCMLRSIFSLIVQDYMNMLIFAPLGLLVLLVHFVVIQYKQRWIDIYLVAVNHVLMFYQIYCEFNFLAQEAFIFGQTMFAVHIVIILVSDFKYAVVQVVMGAVIKLSIGAYFQPSITFQTYTYTAVVSLMILFTLYRTNKQYRQSFLYTSNNNSFDWLIPIVIENPFALCYYDEESASFQVKVSNLDSYNLFDSNYVNQQNLNHLLRNYKIFGKTVEKFLLSRRRSLKKHYINRPFLIINSKNHSDQILIKYSEVFVTELVFVIIIDKREQNHKMLQSRALKLERGVQNFIFNIKQFLKKQFKIMNQMHSKSQIYKFKVNFLYILTKLETNPPLELKTFNLVHKMKTFITLYQLAYALKIETEFYDKALNITTHKNIFYEFLTLLMTFISRQQPADVKIKVFSSYQKHQEYADIQVIISNPSKLYFCLSKNNHFRNLLKIISPTDEPILENNTIVIRLYKDLSEINNFQSFFKINYIDQV